MAETIASLAVRLGADISDFDKKMKEINKTFGRVGRQVADAGTKIGASFAAVSGAIALGLGSAVNKAADFDAQMSRVGAIAGASGDDLEKLRQAALELGASTSKSASEVAQGMELMAAMGFDTTQTIAAMPGVISAAVASGEDMALVAETVASALNSFGLKAEDASRVADVLAQAANDSAAGVQDMQYTFKYAAPVASQLGISLEQLAAATEIMSNSGIRGEQAGTTLRAALLRLSDPPKEAAKQLQALGITVRDANGNMLPFDKIVGQLKNSLEGMGNAQKAAALSAIFGTEAVSGMLTIVEAGPEKFNALTKSLQDSTGASQKASEAMMDNLKGSLEQLGGAVETLQISIGNALSPALRTLADMLQGLVNWFNQLSPQTQQFIAIGAALAAGLTALTAVVGFAVAGLGALAAAEWAVILPVAGIVAGITAAIAVIVALSVAIYKNWGDITKFFSDLWKNVVDIFNKAVTSVSTSISDTWDKISKTTSKIWDGIKDFFAKWWPTLLLVFLGPLGYLIDLIVQHWGDISKATSKAWNAISNFLSGIWTGIKNIASSIWNAVSSAISTPLNMLKSSITSIWNSIKSSLTSVWNGLKSSASNIFSSIADAITRPFRNIHIPTPHFDFSTVQRSIAGVTFPVPKIDVQWYATGGVFEKPAVFGNAGFGDVSEAIVPFEGPHAKRIASLIADEMPRGGDIIIQNMYVRNDNDIKLIARELYRLFNTKSRSLGVTT